MQNNLRKIIVISKFKRIIINYYWLVKFLQGKYIHI